MVSQRTLDSLMATLTETQRLAHDRAHSIERLEHEKAALLEALERICETVCTLGEDHWRPIDAGRLLSIKPLPQMGQEDVIITGWDYGALYGWLITCELPEETLEEKADAKGAGV